MKPDDDKPDDGKPATPGTQIGLLGKFATPGRPDSTVIERLHRGHDGYVVFTRKRREGDAEAWDELFSVKAHDLDNWFPAIREHLERDAYFSVNAFWCPGRTKSRFHPNLPAAARRKRDLRWLTAAFCDLDTGHRPGGLTDGQALGAIVDAQDQGVMPPASVLMRSGRGFWAFWILRNVDTRYELDGPVRAWPEELQAWWGVQRAIGERFDRLQLEADADARDAVRVTRVPGSVNTVAGRRVAYWIQTDAAGQPFTYTLPELCAHLHVPYRKLHPAVRAACSEALRERGKRGCAGRWAKAARQFETLRGLRGGFRHGHRARACFVYACILRRRLVPEEEIKAEVRRLAGECLSEDGRHPDPLPEVEADDAAKLGGSPGPGNLRNDTIADRLQITPDESAQLEGWPPAAPWRTPADPTPETRALNKSERTVARRAFIFDYLRAHGWRVPTLATMQAALDGVNLGASVRTVMLDYKALGVENPRGKARRSEQITLDGT